jgi:DNA-binding beta-propeller fold protein YncE
MKFGADLFVWFVVCGSSLAIASGAVDTSVGTKPPTLKVIRTIPLPDSPPDNYYDYASVDSTLGKLFIGTEDGVTAVDLKTHEATHQFVKAPMVHAVLPLPNGRILTTSGTTDTAILSDSTSGSVIASAKTGRHPDGAAYDNVSGLAVIINILGGTLTLIDPTKGNAVGDIQIGGMLEGGVTDLRGLLYVNVFNHAQIAVVDIGGRKLVKQYSLPGCEEPTGLAIDPETDLLVAACANGKAIALNAKDGKVAAALSIGEGADAMLFDKRRKVFFAPSGDTGTMTVLRELPGPTLTVDQIVKTAKGARTGAVDSQSGQIYLPVADEGEGTFSVEGHPLPKHQLKSFRVLVLGDH